MTTGSVVIELGEIAGILRIKTRTRSHFILAINVVLGKNVTRGLRGQEKLPTSP